MICSKCGETDLLKFYKSGETRRERNLCKECTKRCMREKRRFIKDAAIQYLGGVCVVCGYSKNPKAMDFHHRDSEQKEEVIARMLPKYPSFEVLKKELDKCDLMCCRCHRELHNPDIGDYQFDHSNLLSKTRVRRGKAVYQCVVCGSGVGGKSKNKCCSDDCRFELRTGNRRPTEDELSEMVESNTRKGAAMHYGVSLRTLRGWMKDAGIPLKRQGLPDKVCVQCLESFRPSTSDQVLCSVECHHLWQRRFWPSKDELEAHILDGKSNVELSKIYGVDYKTIKNWMKALFQ